MKIQITGRTREEKFCDSCGGEHRLLRVQVGSEGSTLCLRCFGDLVFGHGGTRRGLRDLKRQNLILRAGVAAAREGRRFLESIKEFELPFEERSRKMIFQYEEAARRLDKLAEPRQIATNFTYDPGPGADEPVVVTREENPPSDPTRQTSRSCSRP